MVGRRRAFLAWVGLGALVLASPSHGQPQREGNDSPERVTVSVSFELRRRAPTVPAPTTVPVVATPYDRPAHPDRQPVEFELSAGHATSIALRRGRWRMEAVAEGLWSEPAEVSLAEGGDRQVQLHLWPAGKVAGRLQPPEDEAIPDMVVAAFRPAPGFEIEEPPRVTVRCPVGEKGRFVCRLPAGRWDLRFQALPYVPRFTWGAAVGAGKVLELGSTRLVRGATVIGWVTTESGASPAGAEVALELRTRDFPASDIREQVRSRGLRARVNDRGFFEIGGVAPGAYMLQVGHDGFATAKVPVSLRTGEYLELRDPPILLSPPLGFDVFVTPPVAPRGERWQMRLRRRVDPDSTRTFRVAEEMLDEAGSTRLEGLDPGSYFAELQAAGTTWWFQPIELAGERGPLVIDLALVEIDGVVSLGGEPLAAKLHFGGLYGVTRIPLTTDEEGYFRGTLPRPGSWTVGVESEEESIRRDLADIEVGLPKGGRPVFVRIELDDTALSGRVVDPSGAAAPNAIVSVDYGTRDAPQAFTGEDGRFTLRGLPAGAIRLQAEKRGGLRSEVAHLVLSEGTEIEHDLVLRPTRKIAGSVFSEAGAVPGARIVAEALGTDSLSLLTTDTDAAGRFSLRPPESARALALQVEPPGFALRLLRVAVDGEEMIRIGVRQDGGTLSVRTGERPPGTFPVIVHGGFVAPLGSLARWACARGGTCAADADPVIVPSLAPGAYAVCPMTEQELRLVGRGAAAVDPGRCVSGSLLPGSTLELELP